ncbi:MAG: ABC transporter permease [Caldilineaceae bacterium]|nr:ABC transporter permease [Caldilineaceae bacterium]MDE0337469.1 ABC transporter permease [Caldilineaceae bacterium]
MDSRPRNLWGDAARRFSRNLLAMISLSFVVLLIFLALFANVLAPEGYDYQQYDKTWLFPSLEHPMGTDPFGRDILTRVIYGARISLAIGFISNIIALGIGLPYGAAAAWYGGAVDFVLIRIIEIINSVPNLLLGILIISVLGPGFRNVLFVFAVTGWMGIARLVRGQFLSLREQDYVLAATCIGVPNYRIIIRHLLPNTLSPIIVSVTLGIPGAILGESGLSFLGIGINPPLPSWGRMLNDYLSAIQSHWYLAFFPGLMIALAMYAFTLMGDGLQDALDPTK